LRDHVAKGDITLCGVRSEEQWRIYSPSLLMKTPISCICSCIALS
jgi:hypothetical protein